MRKKGKFAKIFKTRYLRWLFFKSCFKALPFLKGKFNFYDQIIYDDDLNAQIICDKKIRYSLKDDLGFTFDEKQKDYIRKCQEEPVEFVDVTYKAVIVDDVYLLGNTGLAVDICSQKIIYLDKSVKELNHNRLKAKILKIVKFNDQKICLNLLGVSKSHRHFYHFIADYLMVFWFYLENFYDGDDLRVLVRDDLSKIQQDAYEFIAKKYPKIEFVKVAEGEKIKCQKLILLSYRIDRGDLDQRALFAKGYTDFLNKLFVENYQINVAKIDKDPRRIYIARDDAKLRKILNEKTDLLPILERYGFKILSIGDMPYKEQIELFRSAQVIVTTHGAGLTSLIYCKPETRLLEISSVDFMQTVFLWMAKTIGVKYDYLIGSGDDYYQNFTVDKDEFAKKIQEIIS